MKRFDYDDFFFFFKMIFEAPPEGLQAGFFYLQYMQEVDAHICTRTSTASVASLSLTFFLFLFLFLSITTC
jgi:hypothetical protein